MMRYEQPRRDYTTSTAIAIGTPAQLATKIEVAMKMVDAGLGLSFNDGKFTCSTPKSRGFAIRKSYKERLKVGTAVAVVDYKVALRLSPGNSSTQEYPEPDIVNIIPLGRSTGDKSYSGSQSHRSTGFMSVHLGLSSGDRSSTIRCRRRDVGTQLLPVLQCMTRYASIISSADERSPCLSI
jgi:hypothetical protein